MARPALERAMKSMVVGFLLMWSTQALAQTDLEVIEQAYATFGVGDAEGWAALHTDDFVWTIFGDLPQSGRRVGTQSVIDEVLGVFPERWPALAFETIETFTAGEVVFVHTRMKADGMDTESLHMFKMRDGKIAAFTAFDDTDSMRRSMVD
jgi:ketosteroid isomerase-like protein